MNAITHFTGKTHIGLGVKPLCGKTLVLPKRSIPVRVGPFSYLEENWADTWVKEVSEVNYCKTCVKVFKLKHK